MPVHRAAFTSINCLHLKIGERSRKHVPRHFIRKYRWQLKQGYNYWLGMRFLGQFRADAKFIADEKHLEY